MTTGQPGTGWREVFMGGSPEAEARIFTDVLPTVHAIQDSVSSQQNRKIRRAFHNKGAPVRVEFTVADSLPDFLRTGFLVRGARYEGFGRFSRSQSRCKADDDLDQRGFAFRIIAPDGPQDFLMSNTPISFADDPVTFLKGGRVFATSSKPATPPRLMLALGVKKGIAVLRNILKSPPRDLSFTCQQYWSRTAFSIGESAFSYTAIPSPATPVRVVPRGPDYLSEHLKVELRAGPRRFTLCVQFFVSEEKTPIENANVEWRVIDSPQVPIGEVIVPAQDLDDAAAQALAERVEQAEAFNPWNTRHLHPLGRVNRARKAAYDLSARHRGACPFARD